jgi:serine/threonine protein phosphatase PrpC
MSTATDSAGNVTSLHHKRAAKKQTTQAATLMDQCRDQLCEHMRAAIPAMMDQVDDALFDLADKADTNQLQSTYFEAMRSVRLCRTEIEARFARELDAAIAQRRAPGAGDAGALGSLDPATFCLVEQDDLEESVAVTNLAGKIRNLCHEDLFALDRRVALLLGAPELEGDANPLGPEVVCNAARAAVDVIEADVSIRLLVLKLFDRHLTRAAQQIYPQINAWLVRHGVLPDVRASSRRDGSRHAVSRPRRGAAAGAREASRGGAPVGTPSGAGGQGWESYHADAGAVDGAGSGVAGGGPGGGGSGGAPHHGVPFAGGAYSEQMLAILDQIMRVDGAHGLDVGEDAVQRAHFIGSLTRLQRDAAPVGANLVHELKASGAASGIGRVDGLMIDVVAMMFDFILADRNIADAMRALIARLQIPVLKVAILDKGFFARRSHPARSFINTLAAYGARAGDDADQHEPVFDKVRALVDRILDDFEAQLDVFSAALEELEAIVAEDEAAVQRNAWSSARVAEERERLSRARRDAEQEVDAHLERAPVPAPVVAFLRTHWRHLLGERLFRDGEQGARWREGVQTMDQLLWSITPKPDSASRDRLLAMLPFLLEQLKAGMRELGLSSDVREPFLRALSELHLCALKGGEQAAAAELAPAAPAPATADVAPAPVPDEAPATIPGARASCLLRAAVERANTLVWDAAQQRPQCQGMGATVVALMLEGDQLACAHAGDSRLYRLRDGLLEQITRDHTFRQEVIDKGLTDAVDAAQIASNLITRAVGGDAAIKVEVNVHQTRAGDLYLACSDGLNDMIDDARIQELLVSGHGAGDLASMAQALIAAANEAGGRDNVSVGLLCVDAPLPCAVGAVPCEYATCVRTLVASDVGRRRSHNEDAIDADAARGVLVLADGMGGHNAGEVASAMVVRVVMESLDSAGAEGADGLSQPDALGETFDFDSISTEFWGEHGAAGDPANASLHAAVATEVESITLAGDDLDACFDIESDEAAAAGDAQRDPLLERILRLSCGTWVEFGAEAGAGVRARLSWIAPTRARYLFTDRFGQKVSESTPHGLAVELRRGHLRVLDTVPLFDRALANLTQQLRAGGEAADVH